MNEDLSQRPLCNRYATFEECSGLAPIDTDPVEDPGDETFNP